MGIPARLLNKSVTVTRITSGGITASGDINNSYASHLTGVAMRITNNDMINESGVSNYGLKAESTHIGFCAAGLDIKLGDKVVDGSYSYDVKFVEREPGGALSHHIQLYLKLVQ